MDRIKCQKDSPCWDSNWQHQKTSNSMDLKTKDLWLHLYLSFLTWKYLIPPPKPKDLEYVIWKACHKSHNVTKHLTSTGSPTLPYWHKSSIYQQHWADDFIWLNEEHPAAPGLLCIQDHRASCRQLSCMMDPCLSRRWPHTNRTIVLLSSFSEHCHRYCPFIRLCSWGITKSQSLFKQKHLQTIIDISVISKSFYHVVTFLELMFLYSKFVQSLVTLFSVTFDY